MKILLSGANGKIAQRLLPILLNSGNDVICCVPNRARFETGKYRIPSLSVPVVDLKIRLLEVFRLTLMQPANERNTKNKILPNRLVI